MAEDFTRRIASSGHSYPLGALKNHERRDLEWMTVITILGSLHNLYLLFKNVSIEWCHDRKTGHLHDDFVCWFALLSGGRSVLISVWFWRCVSFFVSAKGTRRSPRKNLRNPQAFGPCDDHNFNTKLWRDHVEFFLYYILLFFMNNETKCKRARLNSKAKNQSSKATLKITAKINAMIQCNTPCSQLLCRIQMQ